MLSIVALKIQQLCLPMEDEAGIDEATAMEAIRAEGFSPDEIFFLTLHILDEVRGDTEMKKNTCQD